MEKIEKKQQNTEAIISFILGLFVLVIVGLYFISASNHSIFGFFPRAIDWLIMVLMVYSLEWGLLFIISLFGIFLGIRGLNSSKKRFANFGIALSFIGFLFYFFFIIYAFLNNPN
jgi:uncharacterized membrane protein